MTSMRLDLRDLDRRPLFAVEVDLENPPAAVRGPDATGDVALQIGRAHV